MNKNKTGADPESEKIKQKNLICLAIESGKLSKYFFNRKQRNIDKMTSTRHAIRQHNSTLKSINLSEDISSINSISDTICTGMISNIFNLSLSTSFILQQYLTLFTIQII